MLQYSMGEWKYQFYYELAMFYFLGWFFKYFDTFDFLILEF